MNPVLYNSDSHPGRYFHVIICDDSDHDEGVLFCAKCRYSLDPSPLGSRNRSAVALAATNQ